MQCTSAWTRITFYAPFILSSFGEFGLCILLGVISWIKYAWTVRRFFTYTRPSNAPVKRPSLTWRDTLGVVTRVSNLFAPDQWVMPLPDQITHVEAALQRTVERAEAQERELRQLRLELDQSRRETEEQKALIHRLTCDNRTQKDLFEAAVRKITIVNSQNEGLANKVMAQHRRIFTLQQQTQKLEQEKLGHQALLREFASVKTLVADNLEPKRGRGTFRSSKRQGLVFSSDDASYVSSYVKTTSALSNLSLSSQFQDALQHSRNTRSHLPTLSHRTDQRKIHNPPSSESSIRAAKTEKRVRKRILQKIDAGISHCRAQGWFRDDFDLDKGGYRREKRVDSGPGLSSVFTMVYP